MSKRYSKYLPALTYTGDLFLLNLLFVAGYCYSASSKGCLTLHLVLFYVYLNVSWLIISYLFNQVHYERNMGKIRMLVAGFRSVVFFFFFFLLFFQIHPLQYYPRAYIKYLFPAYFFLLTGWRFALYYAFYYYRKWGFNYRTVIFVGNAAKCRQLAALFSSTPWLGYKVLGFFGNDKGIENCIGSIGSVQSYLQHNHVDEVYIAHDVLENEPTFRDADFLMHFPVKLRIVPNLGNFSYKTTGIVDYGDVPVIQIHQGPLDFWYNKLLKRVLDLVVAFVVLIGFFWWFTLLLYVISRFGPGGHLFFRQKRTQANGKVFYCLKYRSMHPSDMADTLQAKRNDERFTKVGRYLRKYSLDEIPQFINVLKGEMSVVGPRPHMVRHTEEYSKLIRKFMLRHTVRPGITGLAQVNGFRGEIRNREDLSNRIDLDVQYIENWSLNLDLKIMLQTVWVILRGQKQAF